ncbi:MAG: HAD-IA family hydrolase [Chloroflexota bacterium]|nr:HAD-IA family hydrolase [Anaerolineales bacterium]MCB8965665.1 HAD-IA family hydrolase [Ardenticatenaceae bacterium]
MQRKEPFRAAIFDRNNVLIEYDFDVAQAFFGPLLPISIFELGDRWQTWGETVGFPATPADETPFWQGFWQHLGDELALSASVVAKLHTFEYVSVLRPFPDARPALQAAKDRGLQVGVLSNFPLATIETSLAATNLLDLVDIAFSSTNIGVAKPNPAAYQHIMQALDIAPTDALFFDDTRIHIDGARQLGFTAYLIDRRQADHDLKTGIINNLEILPTLIDKGTTNFPD